MNTIFWNALARLHPAYFAMVMATGIVSIAADLLGLSFVATTLFWLNLPMFASLLILTILRIIRFPKEIVADLMDHQRGMGFFTLIAGAAVLGNQFLIIQESSTAALALWIFATCLWLPLTYTSFTLFTVKPEKPTLASGINGGWLVSVVAAQSVSVLAGILSSHFPDVQKFLLFFALVVWLGGGMLYIWIMTLIFYRYTFFPMSPTDLAPPYWINMGAMAISTLAGTFLIAESNQLELLVGILPFIKGMTLLFWSTATWWIPLLLFLGVWRHLLRRIPITYDPMYWSIVFPLGMYTVCTFRLAYSLDYSPLLMIPKVTIYIALTAWCFTAVGLFFKILRP